ncbi:hypothetical protein ANO14919_080040 [Xylariales sp. No.14919]|nr:hypothetical protein ANO14919_080040 [Xylariales sp. No.14919]
MPRPCSGESLAYVQWTRERLAKHTSYTYRDIGCAAIRRSKFISADVLRDNAINVVDD